MKDEVDEILNRRDIQRYLARKYRIQYAPIWLTGGSSEDGSIVFLDYDLRHRPKFAARVAFHERLEAAIRYCLHWRYTEAHRVATKAESRKYGPEPRELRGIVTKNIETRPKILPRQFDKRLAREAAQSIGR